MKEEAAANAETDKQAREQVEKLNHADSLIFQTEKQMKEFGDKLPADKKGPIETALNKLKEAHKNKDYSGIDASTNELNTVFQAASQEMYNAQAQAMAAGRRAASFTAKGFQRPADRPGSCVHGSLPETCAVSRAGRSDWPPAPDHSR